MWRIGYYLATLRPKLIICYDAYKMGPYLRSVVKWPCRIILSQRGESYWLDSRAGAELYSLRYFDAVWLLSLASYITDRSNLPAYETPVYLLPNGVDTNRFRPVAAEQRAQIKSEWGLPPNTLVVLYLSRLVPKKGAHLLVQCWADVVCKIPNALLWIMGSGDNSYRTRLEAMATALGVTRSIRFQGSVSAENSHRVYQAADVFVLPTLCSEGMSNALLEAMASGLPCVVAEHNSAAASYSRSDVLFVPAPNVDGAFVDPLVSLLSDPARRNDLGSNARRAVAENYSEQAAFARIRSFFGKQLDLVDGINRRAGLTEQEQRNADDPRLSPQRTQ